MKTRLLSLEGGILLYLTADCCILLTCRNLPDPVFSAGILAAFLFGITIAVFYHIKPEAADLRLLLRSIQLQAAFWSMFLLDSILGITRSFFALPEDNYAGGLVLIGFWLSFTLVSAVFLVFRFLILIFNKKL